MAHRPLEDWEYPEPDDGEDEEFVETHACPRCGVSIYEDAARCPACGDYPEPSTVPMAGRPPWFILLGLAGIVAVIMTLSCGI